MMWVDYLKGLNNFGTNNYKSKRVARVNGRSANNLYKECVV